MENLNEKVLVEASQKYARHLQRFLYGTKIHKKYNNLLKVIEAEEKENRFDLFVIFIFNLFSGLSTGYALFTVMYTHDMTSRIFAGIAAAIVGFLFSFAIEKKIIKTKFVKQVYKNTRSKNLVLGFLLVFYWVTVFFISTATTVLWLGGEISGNAEIEALVKRSNDKLLVIDQGLKLEGNLGTITKTWIDQYSSLEEKALNGDFTGSKGSGKLKNTFELIKIQLSDFHSLLEKNQKEISELRNDAEDYLMKIKSISINSDQRVIEKSEKINPLLNKFNTTVFQMQALSVSQNMIMIAKNLDNFLGQGGSFNSDLEEKQTKVLENSKDLIKNTSKVLRNTAEDIGSPEFIPESISTISVLRSIFSQFGSIFVIWGLVIVVDVVGLMLFFFRFATYDDEDEFIEEQLAEITKELREYKNEKSDNNNKEWG